MKIKALKYILVTASLFAFGPMGYVISMPWSNNRAGSWPQGPDSTATVVAADTVRQVLGLRSFDSLYRKRDSLNARMEELNGQISVLYTAVDTLRKDGILSSEINDTRDELLERIRNVSLEFAAMNSTVDSITAIIGPPADVPDPSIVDSVPGPTPQVRKPAKKVLDARLSGSAKDSVVFKPREKMLYSYREGDISYQDMNLKPDYFEMDLETREIKVYGITDSLGKMSRTKFTQDGTEYEIDTGRMNMDSKKLKVRNAVTKEGEGWLIASEIKKVGDNIYGYRGKYTTCDHVDHPHYYILLNKAKFARTKNGKKVFAYGAHFVLEDVPLYFPYLPFFFFPISDGRSSGFIMPSFGEEYVKGFFLRDIGYYYAINDYIDVQATGSLYTLGSWDASLSSRYIKRYKYSGNLTFHYSNDVIGEKGSADYVNSNNMRLSWQHRQDPKFKPNSSFTASVNFSTSGYSKYGSTNMNDYLSTQTNSSIAYTKSWPGKPYSFSASFRHSQNSRDSTISLSFPDLSFNVTQIYPFKRKIAMGKARWYEKINIRYSGKLQNSVTAKERDLFKESTLKKMKNGVSHSIPISTSWTILKHINVTASANYDERWYFQSLEKEWDPVQRRVITSDTTYGFNRVYNYRISGGLSTKVYGLFQFGEESLVKAIRHVITPQIGFSITPDFSDPKYGYYKAVQTDSMGTIGSYSPYEGAIYGIPGRGRSAAMTFSLQQNLEMKVRSKRDTTGQRIIKIVDNLSLSSNYNFLADSLNLAPISFSLRTPLTKMQTLNLNGSLDPYQVDKNGRKINKFMLEKGKLVRLTSVSTSFSHSFNPNANNSATPTDGTTQRQHDYMNDPAYQHLDPATRSRMASMQYYDYDLEWNFAIDYSFSYTNNGVVKSTTQTVGFSGFVRPTSKWNLRFSAGYDFKMKVLTPGTVSIERDLHCFHMSLDWVPIGYRKSWSFRINILANTLKDIKYDKHSSFYDNLYE